MYLYTKQTVALRFKEKQFNLTFVLHVFQLPTPVTEIELKENIYVWMQNKRFETKMWCYTLVFGKLGQPALPPIKLNILL